MENRVAYKKNVYTDRHTTDTDRKKDRPNTDRQTANNDIDLKMNDIPTSYIHLNGFYRR